ncbi:MAG: HD-GYP domain-containing protein, partial [Chloroflexota bacterium]
MKLSTDKMGRQWWQRFAEITSIKTNDPATKRKGQLLALYILLIWVILVSVTVSNIIYLVLQPSLEYTYYLIQELALIGLYYIFWRMNRQGKVLLTAHISIALAIVLAVLINDARYLEYAMVIFALPIGISSFIIRPSVSFAYAFLTAAGFTLSAIYWNYTWEYNLTAIIALFSLAFMTWVAAQQLENALEDNDELVRNLQKTFEDLESTYDTTLEGWSRALEIRDRETEGHTQRVTTLAVRIAAAMGYNEEQLLHIRRGALLHDIGKLGVPDEILWKPGPLTEPEMQIMRTHPQIAYDLLLPIEYLRPALIVPYYHNEKWDGTGYPHDLKGEAIPLEARIFAVVDVYDALSYDRPYRKAWDKQKVLEYIRAESG